LTDFSLPSYRSPVQMDGNEWRRRASSFGTSAALYDQVRPTYPADAVSWALAPLGPGRHRIADIGAGTGLLTRVIASLGYDTVAVEPDELMRARLTAGTAGVGAVPGHAERLPFGPGELAGAMAGQAYHWFDRGPTHAELTRVIRPGGVFAAIWNERDVTVAWLAEYSRIVGRSTGAHDVPPSFGEHFEPTERAEFRHHSMVTPAGLVGLMQSRSYYLTASPARQAALVAEIRDLAATHPDLAGSEQFALPYLTEVYRGVRSSH
jgi:SAM-dependent methyltransferase